MEVDGLQFSEEQVSFARAMVDRNSYVQVWGLEGNLGAHQFATEYCLMASWSAWFCTSWHVPYVHPQRGEGVLGLYSNGASTRAQKARAGLAPGMADPHWADFGVYFFPGVFLGDLKGMIAAEWQYEGTTGELLDRVFPAWRVAYPQVYDQTYYDSLRDILRAIGIDT